MDVDNRALDDAGGTDGDDGYADGGDGLPEEAGAGGVQDAGSADLQADLTDEGLDETEQLGALEASEESADTNLRDDVFEVDPSPHSLLSVLFPAKPPRPRNARIVRLFDLEAAKNDPEPGEAPVVEQPPKEEPRTREAIRAARNQSLLAAARLR
jgi:hypothetical protein